MKNNSFIFVFLLLLLSLFSIPNKLEKNENLDEKIEIIKRIKQILELNTVNEMKNTMKYINNRFDQAVEKSLITNANYLKL